VPDRAGRLRSRHGDGVVRVQGEHGPQVLDGPPGPLRRPIDTKPAPGPGQGGRVAQGLRPKGHRTIVTKRDFAGALASGRGEGPVPAFSCAGLHTGAQRQGFLQVYRELSWIPCATRCLCAALLSAVTTCRAASGSGSCSQMRTTIQPPSLRAWSTSRSRSTLRSSFGPQYQPFDRGELPWFGQRCQKQPSTKTAMW
jgi:hypothetical protein